MTKTKILVFLTLLFLNFCPSHAQPDQDKVSLISILTDLRQKFDCSFTYIDQDIQGIILHRPADLNTLKENITYLKNNTPFEYTILDDQNVVLSLKTEREICGILQSQSDNSKIVNATIETQNDSSISDKNGEFVIRIKSPNELVKISFLGYKSLFFSAKDFFSSGTADSSKPL